jgi:hypothetical protein
MAKAKKNAAAVALGRLFATTEELWQRYGGPTVLRET